MFGCKYWLFDVAFRNRRCIWNDTSIFWKIQSYQTCQQKFFDYEWCWWIFKQIIQIVKGRRANWAFSKNCRTLYIKWFENGLSLSSCVVVVVILIIEQKIIVYFCQIIRFIKHDIRINAGPKNILAALSKDAYPTYQTSQNLKQVVQKYGDNICDVDRQPKAKKVDKVRYLFKLNWWRVVMTVV